MSAITNPSASPAISPRPEPPETIPSPPKKSRRWWVWGLLAAVIVGAAAVYQVLLKQPAPATPGVVAVRTATVAPGTMERTLRIAGQTSAISFASITVPIMRGPDTSRDMVLMTIVKPGTSVKAGDVIAQIDAQAQQDHIDDVQSTVTQSESDIKKRQAEHWVDSENLQHTLRLARADFDKAKLDHSAAEVRTAIDQELLQLYVEEAEARYKQIQQELPLRQEVQKAELRILEITRHRHILHRDRHVADLKRFTFRAPIGGIAVMQSTFRGGEIGQIQEGDEVRSGQTFMKIVDPSSMQVEADVNQVASEYVRIGQPAIIGLDAFPGLTFKGKVHSIGAMGVGGWRENYYIRRIPVRIAIEGSDPRLIPDLSAWANVIVEQKEDALLVPLAALRPQQDKTFVRVKKGDRFETREVQLGARNATHAVVLAGLSAGEEVVVE